MPSLYDFEKGLVLERTVPMDWFQGDPWGALRSALKGATEALVVEMQLRSMDQDRTLPLTGTFEMFMTERLDTVGVDTILHVRLTLPPKGPADAATV